MNTVLDEMRAYVGFSESDAAGVRQLAHLIGPHLGVVVQRFYDAIFAHPGAAACFPGGQAQADRLKVHFRGWLEEVFKADYGPASLARRGRIGDVHVRLSLPQHYMFGALEVIWAELESLVRQHGGPDDIGRLPALHKALSIEAALMLESYKQHYSERIRQLEHRQIEERLSRAEHLAELGQLAASLAHEIKNPLAGISGAIQVIRKGLGPEDGNKPILDEVLRQVRRVDRTIQDLLAYARPHSVQIESCDLARVIERSTMLLKQEKSFAAARFECGPLQGLPTIEADENQIEQLLVNLLLNAAQASQPGDPIRLTAASQQDEVVMVVEDRGHGVDPETLARVFEPFFTTKARGTGLGLAVARRIVDGHRGSIAMRSESGRGTTVEVRLPVRRGSSAPRSAGESS